MATEEEVSLPVSTTSPTTYTRSDQLRDTKTRAVTVDPDTNETLIYPESVKLDKLTLFHENAVNENTHIKLRTHLHKEGRLTTECILHLLTTVTESFKTEQNLIELGTNKKINVIGDIHGQFYDLLTVFEKGGEISENSYIFLGDYVDRGNFSIEVLIYLYYLKIHYPSQITLLRGNHENKHICETFTFEVEVDAKYNTDVYNACIDSFNVMPLAATVNNYLCVHGGISPELNTIEEIQKLDRFREVPVEGPMNDLVWADPWKNYNADTEFQHFLQNMARGCSYYFTYQTTCQWLENNKLDGILRAHEVQMNGYREYFSMEGKNVPTVTTIFSAPNYCQKGNKAAFLKLDGTGAREWEIFEEKPSPYWLPDFVDVITWSLPFAAEKITDILLRMTETIDDESSESDTTEMTTPIKFDQNKAVVENQEDHNDQNATKVISEETVKTLEKTDSMKDEPANEAKKIPDTDKEGSVMRKIKTMIKQMKMNKKSETQKDATDLSDKTTDAKLTTEITSDTLEKSEAELKSISSNVFTRIVGSIRHRKSIQDKKDELAKITEFQRERLCSDSIDPSDVPGVEDPDKIMRDEEVIPIDENGNPIEFDHANQDNISRASSYEEYGNFGDKGKYNPDDAFDFKERVSEISNRESTTRDSKIRNSTNSETSNFSAASGDSNGSSPRSPPKRQRSLTRKRSLQKAAESVIEPIAISSDLEKVNEEEPLREEELTYIV